MLKPNTTYPIEDVWIDLTFPDDQQEKFQLEAPNGGDPFRFRFVKIAKLEDYRDAENNIQRGCYFYQLQLTYDYEAHNMDLKKLLIASNIRLRFPPAFGQKHNYNVADVLLANDETVKNYLQGLAIGSDAGEIVPSGSISLEFEGVDAFSEFQIAGLFGWNQSDNADEDPDEEDGGGGGDGGVPDDEDFSDDIFYVIDYGGSSTTDDNYIRKIQLGSTPETRTVLASYKFPPNSEISGINGAVGTDPNLMVSRNGNVVFVARFPSGRLTVVFLLDADLNLITYKTTVGPSSTFGYGQAIDTDNSIYVCSYFDTFPGIRKYDSALNVVWDAGITASTTQYNVELTTKFVIEVIKPTGLGETFNFVFRDREDGSIIKTYDSVQSSQSPTAINFIDGSFLMVYGDDAELFDIDGNIIDNSLILTNSAINSPRQTNEATKSNEILARQNVTGAGLLIYNPDYSIKYTIGSFLEDTVGNAFPTTNPNIWLLLNSSGDSNRGKIYKINLETGVRTLVCNLTAIPTINVRYGTSFAMRFDNWQVLPNGGGGVPPEPKDFIYSLNAYPKIGSAPHKITVEYSVVNRTGTPVLPMYVQLDGSDTFAFNVPANYHTSGKFDWEFFDAGTYVWTLGDQTQTIYVDTDRPPGAGNYEGSIEILSKADSNFLGTKATNTIEVIGSPIRQSDPCDGGGEKFNVIFEGTTYCMTLPAGSKNIIASAVSGQISSDVANLGSSAGELSFVGNPLIRVTHELIGSEHNGKTVTFSVNSGLESDGGVFNKLDVYLLDGQDPAIIDDPVDIFIGGISIFATTENIVGDESASSIATKIFNALNSVYSEHLTFEKIGNKIRIISSLEEHLTVALFIRNAGFDYVTENITEQ